VTQRLGIRIYTTAWNERQAKRMLVSERPLPREALGCRN
jgi:hypothetical protein